MDIYIKIILFDYIINGADSKLNNSKKSIFKIEFRDMIVFILETKYY